MSSDEQYAKLFKALRDLGIITKVTEWKTGKLYYCKIEFYDANLIKSPPRETQTISGMNSKSAARGSLIKELMVPWKSFTKPTLALAEKIIDGTIADVDFTESYLDDEESTVELIYYQDGVSHEFDDVIVKNNFSHRKEFYKQALASVCSSRE